MIDDSGSLYLRNFSLTTLWDLRRHTSKNEVSGHEHGARQYTTRVRRRLNIPEWSSLLLTGCALAFRNPVSTSAKVRIHN